MNTQAATQRSSSQETLESRELGQVIAGLSRYLDDSRIGAGDLAELRRIDGNFLPPAFWKLYLNPHVVPSEWREPTERVDVGIDRAWAGFIRAMVEMAPRPHAFSRPFGEALAASGYSETRFVRLLRAEREDLARELRIAGAWLANAGVLLVNWEQPAHLALRRLGLPVRHRTAVHRMARDYFREAAKQSPSK